MIMECTKWFVHARCFQKPTRVYIKDQPKINVDSGFPSMFASLDYMHYT